ncbi:MAG: hypothetical protein N4A33_04680 [Bacteriovoracaceae bacterium]|jgi:hypothetical protein|nr:hypothetical protein [Bacteriovoracaceae bacterium]
MSKWFDNYGMREQNYVKASVNFYKSYMQALSLHTELELLKLGIIKQQ